MPTTFGDNVLPALQGKATISPEGVNTFPSYCILDTITAIGINAQVSLTAICPGAIHLDPVPVGTQVKVQAKAHKDATWVTLFDTDTLTERSVVHSWVEPLNFVRVVVVYGSGHVKAFATVHSSSIRG